MAVADQFDQHLLGPELKLRPQRVPAQELLELFPQLEIVAGQLLQKILVTDSAQAQSPNIGGSGVGTGLWLRVTLTASWRLRARNEL